LDEHITEAPSDLVFLNYAKSILQIPEYFLITAVLGLSTARKTRKQEERQEKKKRKIKEDTLKNKRRHPEITRFFRTVV